jgi:hypothetical protein
VGSQVIGKMNEFVDELEKFWWVRHFVTIAAT